MNGPRRPDMGPQTPETDLRLYICRMAAARVAAAETELIEAARTAAAGGLRVDDIAAACHWSRSTFFRLTRRADS